jgi:hypothetical protein
LIDLLQGEKMTNFDLNIIQSTLDVKASGHDNESVLNDLNLPEGKSIAQLLYEQKKETQDPQKDVLEQ